MINLDEKILKLANEAENQVKDEFEKIDKIAFQNSQKVLNAFQKNKVAEVHFQETTGYGYGDIGRDTIEAIYATIFHAEDSLVRGQFISGSHALTVTLFGLLRPGDTMMSITGKPYDTLDSVIGFNNNPSSLKSYGVEYEQVDLKQDELDVEMIQKKLREKKIKLIEIQRSRGYSTRESISIEKVESIIKKIREVDPHVIVMIDNCYCEFVGEKEPIEVGADIAVGSLIKNLGGGIAPNGAYVVGRKDLIALVAERLTVPGQGKEVGTSLGMNRKILQGLFEAPSVVKASLKTAILASQMLENLGYKVRPRAHEPRVDIVQTIEFGNAKDLIRFCQGIQMGSPVDSQSVPEPWEMPGYDDKVIMADGSFVAGSSIELSCDAPIREPYMAYLQGGLTYEYGKLGVLKAIQNLQA